MRSFDGAHCSAIPQVHVLSVQSEANAGYGTLTTVRAAFIPKPRRSPDMRRTLSRRLSDSAEATTAQLRSTLRA
jgi:hypothetical protein